MTVYEKAGGAPKPVPSAYLDTCLVIGLRTRDLEEEQEALTGLLRLGKAGAVRIVTSRVTADELERAKPEMLPQQEEIYLLLSDVPPVGEELELTRLGTNQGLAAPRGIEDRDLAALRAILNRDDARHVFQAIKNGLDYFVTTDKQTILKRARRIESRFPIKIRPPSALVAELST
jgi:hypothetical protein